MATTTAGTTDFVMPSLGADMTEGRITEWLVQPGDSVTRGQIVVVVETDKSDIEVEVFEPGTVTELLVPEGERVAVGTPIARIEPVGATPAHRTPPAQAVPAVPTTPPAPRPGPAPATPRITSPVIRHLAEQLDVAPAEVRATGAGGRVHRDDVERAAAVHVARPAPVRRAQRVTPRARKLLADHGLDAHGFGTDTLVTGDVVLAALAAPPPPVAVAPDAGRPDRAATMRRHIADLMARSWAEIPHYHVTSRLDLTAATDALTRHNATRPLAERVVPGTALLCATARAAAAVPACNGWWRDGGFVGADSVRLGVVLSLRSGGIIVPTIVDADTLGLDEMMQRLAELVQRARQGRLRASDMVEATITVTNLGDRGAESVVGVIQPPQVALVGIGVVHDGVWASGGAAAVRPTANATLSGDHRAIDGLTGSRFLARMQTALDRIVEQEITGQEITRPETEE